MSNIAHKVEAEVGTFFSGGPNTTGREPFEDGTKLVPVGEVGTHAHSGPHITSGSAMVGSEHGVGHSHHSHSHEHGSTGTGLTSGTGLSSGTGTGISSGTGSGISSGTGTGISSGTGTGISSGTHSHSHEHGHGTHGTGAHTHGIETAGGDAITDRAHSETHGAGSVKPGFSGPGLDHHHDHHATGEGKSHTGIAAAAAVTGATGAASHEHHRHNQEHIENPATGATRTFGTGINTGGNHTDRVGALDQGAGAYERTGASGPATTGAAGTDRFDTDKLRDNLPGSGTHTGTSHTGIDPNQGPREEKSKGGLAGVFATSDKDFTNRDRIGGTAGAYADSHGPFQGNTSGPGGNTALTGREGNTNTNPVSRAESALTGTGTGHTGTSRTGGVTSNVGQHNVGPDGEEKKSFMQKVKDAIA